MGRTVDDAHLLLAAQVDYDPRDPFSHPGVSELAAPLREIDLGSLRIAVPPDLGCCPVDKGIARVFGERVQRFSRVFGAVEETAPDFGDIHNMFEVLRGLSFVSPVSSGRML